MEQQKGKEDYVENQSKRRKYRSRQQRVCIMNALCVLKSVACISDF